MGADWQQDGQSEGLLISKKKWKGTAIPNTRTEMDRACVIGQQCGLRNLIDGI